MENLTLAFDVVGRIKTSPSSFRMRYWGVPHPTRYTACIAGHTLLAKGYHLANVNTFLRPDASAVLHPGMEAAWLLGFSREECRRGIHFWACDPFCENMPEDAALDNFLKLILEEEERRIKAPLILSA